MSDESMNHKETRDRKAVGLTTMKRKTKANKSRRTKVVAPVRGDVTRHRAVGFGATNHFAKGRQKRLGETADAHALTLRADRTAESARAQFRREKPRARVARAKPSKRTRTELVSSTAPLPCCWITLPTTRTSLPKCDG